MRLLYRSKLTKVCVCVCLRVCVCACVYVCVCVWHFLTLYCFQHFCAIISLKNYGYLILEYFWKSLTSILITRNPTPVNLYEFFISEGKIIKT